MRRAPPLALLLAAAPALLLAPRASAQVGPPPSAPPAAPPSAPSGPPPPESPPRAEPPPPEVLPQPAPAAPAGQWVHTIQYGWLWMPYSQQFTYVPADPQVFPDQYVYYPAYGWRWVVAPWVYGYGPAPFWGTLGVRPYAWYARPWFRVGGYWGWGGYRGWGRYRGWVGPRAWGPRGWVRAPAYYRTGMGGPHPEHVFRPEPAWRGPARERIREERQDRWR